MAVLFLVAGVVVLLAATRAPARVFSSRGVALIAVVAAVEAGLLTWFVRSDDPNVAGPRPRWDYYQGGATHPLYWIALALDAAAVVLAASSWLSRSRPLAYAVALACAGGLGTGAAAVFGFSLT